MTQPDRSYVCDILDYCPLITEQTVERETYRNKWDYARDCHTTEEFTVDDVELVFNWKGKTYRGQGDWYGEAKKDLLDVLQKENLFQEIIKELGEE